MNNELDGRWKKEESNALVFLFTGGDPGPSIPIDSSMSAFDLFGKFFTEEVWELITVETIRYASKQRQQCLHVSPRAWHDVSVPEMNSFIGILILMGICRMLRLGLCNSEREITPDNPGYDYLFKVRNLIDLLSPHFLSQYTIRQELLWTKL